VGVYYKKQWVSSRPKWDEIYFGLFKKPLICFEKLKMPSLTVYAFECKSIAASQSKKPNDWVCCWYFSG
jgi:hypothetical protein